VTAQKRRERPAEVPISLQVLSSEKLDQLQVHDLDDYAKLLAERDVQSNGPGQAELFFRGISTSSSATPLHAGFLPSSGLYLDEIPVTTVAGALDVHVYDIARVEALADPRERCMGASSLFRHAAHHHEQTGPVSIFRGLRSQGGQMAHGNPGGGVEGYVNIPVGEHAAVRLVGYYDPRRRLYQQRLPAGHFPALLAHRNSRCGRPERRT